VGVRQPARLLEPSCGDGVFLRVLAPHGDAWPKSIFACELNPTEAAKARAAWPGAPLQLHVGDFLQWFLFHGRQTDLFDAVLGNPPFIRYQYLSPEQQSRAEKVFEQFHLPFTRHTNSWVPFVIAALALLRPGGRLAMVVPAEIFHIRHAQPLRRFLTEQCARLLILDPEELWFRGTLQGTVLLLAEKKPGRDGPAQGIAVLPIHSRGQLAGDPEEWFVQAPYATGSSIEDKWMPLFLAPAERALLTELQAHPRVRPFAELASVDIGIVTGANRFFLVPDAVVEEHALHTWAHPMFGRSEHAHGLIYSLQDHQANQRSGLPANFLWFQEDTIEQLPPNAQRYLEKGVAEKLPERFKCAVRTPWFRVPSVYAAPVSMLKRAHHYPRLILNQANAYTTDTAYRIQPLRAPAEALVFAFINSLTCLTAELEGRHYGGGVLELVPSEIERLLIPVVDCAPEQLIAADQAFREATDDLAFLSRQDAVVLGSLGLAPDQQAILFNACARLRQRRHRVPSEERA
jgi:adenine-specific DNA-methyltransferase